MLYQHTIHSAVGFFVTSSQFWWTRNESKWVEMSRPAESKTKQNKKTRDSHMSIYRMYIAFKNTISHYAWRKKSLPKLTVKSSRSTYRHARLYVDIYIYIYVYLMFISVLFPSFQPVSMRLKTLETEPTANAIQCSSSASWFRLSPVAWNTTIRWNCRQSAFNLFIMCQLRFKAFPVDCLRR